MRKILAVLLVFVLLVGACVAVSASNIWGDIDTNGAVDIIDSVKLAQYLAEWSVTFTADEKAAADVFYDGIIDTRDAVRLAQYLAEWDVVLGEPEPSVPDEPSGDHEIEADDLVNSLIIYPEFPDRILRNYDYDVSVTMGSKTEKLPVYNHTVESNVARRPGIDMYRRFSMFAFEGGRVRVDIKVKTDFTSYTVFPSAKNFESTFSNGVISVYLDEPEYFGIMLDDDHNSILSIFADYPESGDQLPKESDSKVIRISGWYETASGILEITEPNTVLYIEPGAVLNARVMIASGATGCRVIGRGAIVDPFENIYEYDIRNGGTEGSKYKLLTIKGSGTVADGPVLLDARCYNIQFDASNATVRNMKALSSMMTTDGITITGANSYVENLWLYVGDNGIVFSGKNCTIKEVAIGTTCAALFPQATVVNMTFEDIYVFRADDGIITNRYNGSTSVPAEDRTPRSVSFTVRRLSAMELPSLTSTFKTSGTMHLFQGANMGTLEKTVVLEDVSVAGINSNRTIHFRNTSGEYGDLYTDNYNLSLRNLYVNGTGISSSSDLTILGTTDGNTVTLTSDPFYTPVTRNETVVNYTAPDKVYVGSRQVVFDKAPVRSGGVLMLPTDEICAVLRGTCDITSEYVSAEELFTAGLVSAAQENGGNLYLTPTYNGENLLLPDSGEISRYAEQSCYQLDLVVSEDSDGYIYSIYSNPKSPSLGAGMSRSIRDEIRMYGTGTYRLTLRAKAVKAGTIRILCSCDGTSVKTQSLNVTTDWQEFTIDFSVDSTSINAFRSVIAIIGGGSSVSTDLLDPFSVRDLVLTKIS